VVPVEGVASVERNFLWGVMFPVKIAKRVSSKLSILELVLLILSPAVGRLQSRGYVLFGIECLEVEAGGDNTDTDSLIECL